MNVFVYKFREGAKKVLGRYWERFGCQVLDTAGFRERFPGSRIESAGPEGAVEVPGAKTLTPDCTAAPKLAARRVDYPEAAVYRLSWGDFPRMRILSSGGVQLDEKSILATGLSPERGSQMAAQLPDLRRRRGEQVVIAPFPHHWKAKTYGDFLLTVLPRICRVLAKMSPEYRDMAVIAYPLFKTGYETALLSRLGFPAERLVDTREVRVDGAREGLIYCTNGEPGGWADRGSHPADYQAVRRLLGITPEHPAEKGRRLYLRRTARRKILNEEQIRPLLRAHGFEEVDPAELSCDEQIRICGEASVLLGMHGANIANLLWCAPGTTIVELFGRGFQPAFYRMMAFNLGLNYRYWVETPMVAHDFANVNWDVTCDSGVLRSYLEAEWGS